MTKISIYSKDVDVRGNDRWIGSDAQNQNRTKNFTPDNVAVYFNENQVIDLGVELRYFYDTLDPLQQRVFGSITFETEIGPHVNFSAISTFILSKYTMGHTDVSQFLDFLIGSNVLLSRANNINMFGYYKIDNIEPYLPDPNFFVVTLTFETGNGYMKEDEDYFISLVQFEQTIPEVPTKTSDLINDGEDGVHPFITADDVPTPTLQSVTDEGDTTTTTVHLDGGAMSNSINEQAIFQPDLISTVNLNSGSGASLDSTGKVGISPDGLVSTLFAADNITQDITLQAPNKTAGSYTLATTDDVPTKTSDLINDGENGVDPFITAADIPPVTGFVPYTGATEDVNLGEFGLLTGNIEFDNTPTNIPTTAGAIYWNDADGTADLILKGGNVKLQIGQESVIRVVNKTATNINLLEANYQAVRVTGAQGQRLKVDLAQATTDNLSAETIGLVTETINNNQEGFITTSGLVRSINTTGSLQGETWADGDILYLSPTTAGNITKVKPTAPNHLVIVGYVVHAHANQGSIFVKVDNGYELDELHNVKITSAANNNVLAYTSATDIWENKTVETALGYTPENVANKSTSTSLGTSNTLYPTQNAVKVYADTKFTLPSLTSGSVLFSDGTTIAQNNTNLFWNNSSIGLCLGGTTLDSNIIFQINGGKGARISGTGAGFGYSLVRGSETGNYGNNGSGSSLSSTTTLLFNTAATERMRVNSSGNLLLNTTTDAGFKLDVNGTARVSGNTTITPAALTGTAATSALDIAQTWNTTGAPTAIKLNITDTASAVNTSLLMDLQVGGASRVQVNKTGALVFRLGSTIRPSNGTNAIATSNLNGLNFISNLDATTTNVSDFIFVNNQGNPTNTTGTRVLVDITRGFSPTSGTGQYIDLRISPTINQTGGANGITRGLYINPTLTAAADFRAIEVANGITILGASTTAKASLRIPSGTAPTTPTNGDIWFDGTNLKMQIGGVTKTFTLI